MTSHRVYTFLALLAALMVAALLKAVMIDWGALGAAGQGSADFWTTLFQVYTFGLPLGAVAAVVTEILRLRKLAVQLAIGIGVTFLATYLATRSEAITSHVFSGGPLLTLALVTVGLGASAAYWALAGRRAGWRGDRFEGNELRVADAYRRASDRANIDVCRVCLLYWCAAVAAVAPIIVWLLMDATGLRSGVLADAEYHGRAVLRGSGYSWANFSIAEGRGVIEGDAPDELEKRAAYDAAREALSSITGFPGVISGIEDRSVARVPMASVSQKLAEVTRREQEAKAAVDEARRAAEVARTAADEAKRQAAEQAAAVEAEYNAKLEVQKQAAAAAAAAEAAAAAKAAAEAEARAVAQAQAAAEAEAQVIAEAKAAAEAGARAAEVAEAEALAVTKAQAAAPVPSPGDQQPTSGPRQVATVTVEEQPVTVGAVAPTPDEVGASVRDAAAPGVCADQDLALVESSRVLFHPQSFDVDAGFANELDRVATSVRACAPRPIQITGTADLNADALFNPALALQRAEAVRDGLIARGISPSRIVIAAEPVGFLARTDAAPAERAGHRRTEFRFLEATALSRDATQAPDERANNCESDLTAIMARSVIRFPTASAQINPESMGLIIRLANAIRTCGSVIVTIEGHTDRSGTNFRNQTLSEERANSVREALITVGVDQTRVASRGFASSRPYSPGENAEAYALNRRIEFRVSSKFTTTNAGGP